MSKFEISHGIPYAISRLATIISTEITDRGFESLLRNSNMSIMQRFLGLLCAAQLLDLTGFKTVQPLK